MFGINVVTLLMLSALGKHTCEMATFKVDKVKKSTTPLQRAHLGKLLETRMGRAKPESHFKPESERPIVETYGRNAFVSAVHTAYSSHYPLVLSPDHIWMCIAQGLSRHVNANPEKLRKMFVEHEGKKTLLVQRNDFIKGSPDNPWPEVFDEFSEQIREHVGEKTHDLLTPDFTTTGQNERAAAQVVLMDTFKEYFEYLLLTLCGIPEITLEGTVEDWKKLRERAVGLAQYDLDWWINALKPILDQFVNAASGKVDKKFWSTIYKQQGGSGGPYITGWIITLFPYCLRRRSGPSRNPYLENWNELMFGGMTSGMFPPGIVSTPFKWEYYHMEIPMHFYAGFMAVSQDPNSLSLRPVIGWAVVDDKKGMSSNERTISSSSLNKTEGNNSNVIWKVAPSVGLPSSKKCMIISSSMKKTKGNNIWKVAPSVALVSSKESMISSSIWKVASTIALAESVVGIISNSLLLLLTYSNPLNNLRGEASWITITNLAAAHLLTSILTIPFCHPVFKLSLRHASEMQYLSTEVLLHIGYAGSFFLLMLFAIERYIAIKHPTESGNILTKNRVFLACLLCWAAAIGCALPIISKSAGFLIAFYGILELSVLIMILFQVLTIRSIKEASRHLEDGSKRKAHMKDISTTIVILILVLMVTAFPYFIAKQAEYFYRDHPHLFTEMVAHMFPYYYFPVACLNFIVNPFIYAWRLPDYRKAFKELLNRKLLFREMRAQRNFHRFSSQIISEKETITMTSC